jgi:glycosyltransferase involved in cell wall biosynthesis
MRSKLRVALIAPPWLRIPPPGYGGIESVVALLADGLAGRGHDVTLFAPGGSSTEARLVPLPDQPLGTKRIGQVWPEAIHALEAYLQAGKADVIHDHSGVVGPGLGAMLDGDPPVVCTIHGPWRERWRRLFGLVHDRVHLVAISRAQQEANPDVRYAGLVHNAVDLERLPMTPRKGDHLVFVGRCSPDKGPELAVEIARRAGRPLVMMVKRAEPAERAHWERAVAPRLAGTEIILEEVSPQRKAELLGSARAMLFPIRWPEPFGLVMAEAMACGTPVVARPEGAASEVVLDGRTGFLRSSLDEMVEAVELAGDISPEECRSWVERSFSPESMVRGYEAVYRRVAAGDRLVTSRSG